MLELNFQPFPVLQTERLVLRQVREEDAPEVFRMRADPEMMRYIPRPVATSILDAIKVIRIMEQSLAKNDSINWAMTLKGESRLIGTIGYVRLSKEDHRGEVGYMMDPSQHGKGLMNEALQAVLQYGFEQMGFHTIEGVIDPGNTASEKLLIKNGFVKEGHFRQNALFEGRWLDSVHYTLFADS